LTIMCRCKDYNLLNNYDEERKKLFDWSTQELIRIEKEFPLEPGLDGQAVLENKNHFREYNKRLLELKEKYGIKIVETA